MSWIDTLLGLFKRQTPAPATLPEVEADPPPMPAVPLPAAPVVAPAWKLTTEALASALSIPVSRAMVWTGPLEQAMVRFAIDTPEQRAAFLAQVAHESGKLVYVREIWGPTPAQSKYEGRLDLGNTQPGDGKRFLGRGLIQITGRANYAAVSKGLGIDFVSNPSLLELTDNAAMSAAWFWYAHGLNAYVSNFTTLTRKINGGINGLADREALWASCKIALGVTA
jgi:putative chitinase